MTFVLRVAVVESSGLVLAVSHFFVGQEVSVRDSQIQKSFFPDFGVHLFTVTTTKATTIITIFIQYHRVDNNHRRCYLHM